MRTKALYLISIFWGFIAAASVLPAPWNGTLTLNGNGKFFCRGAVLPLASGKAYQLSFQIQKNAPLSPKAIEHRLVLYVLDNAEKHKEIATFADEVPVDNQPHSVAAAFKIPPDATGQFKLFAYNCNAQGSMQLTDIRLEEIEVAAPEISGNTNTAVSVTPTRNSATANDGIIRPKLSNLQPARLEGNGRFLYIKETIPAIPGKTYDVTFEMRKEGEMSRNPAEHRVVFILEKTEGGCSEFMYAGETVPVDGQWHQVKAHCTIPTDAGKITIFIYNVNSEGVLELRNLEIIPRDRSAVNAAQPTPQPSSTPTDDGVIRPQMGNKKMVHLEGNGQFLYAKETLPVISGASYDITFEMRKEGEMSRNPIEHRVVFTLEKAEGGCEEFMYAGENVPVDGQWHQVKAHCTIPTGAGKNTLFIYNVNSEGILELRNLELRKK